MATHETFPWCEIVEEGPQEKKSLEDGQGAEGFSWQGSGLPTLPNSRGESEVQEF